MIDTIANGQYNASFLSKIGSLEGQQQFKEAASQALKTELLESAFHRAIINQEPITAAECQRNTNDDTLYVIRDIEPDAAAVAVDNLGEPDGRYVKGQRYIIPIVNFTTDRFQITENDLRAYQYKVTKRLQDKSAPILHRLEDIYFIKQAGAALSVAAAGKEKGVKGVNSNNLELAERDFVTLKNTLSSGINGSDTKRKEVACMLMCQEAYETAVFLPGAGDDFGKERIIDGLNSARLYGTEVVKTIKSDILPTGHVFAFTSGDFLGHSFSLGDPIFEIESRFGMISWQSRESIAIGIGNALSVALLTLPGSVNPGGSTDLTIATNGTITANISNYYKGLKL